MSYRRDSAHVDTVKRPEIELWPDQPNIMPVAVSEESEWTLNLMQHEADGHIGGSALAQGASAERDIPGIIPGHLYRLSVKYSISLEDITVTLGGKTVMTLDGGSAETKHHYVVPINGEPLKFLHEAVGNFTGAIEEVSIEAMEPLSMEKLVIPAR